MADALPRLKAALAGRYTIERELGRGGMATVYLAHDLRHDRPVALKVLRPELAAAIGPERFLREIQIAARLTHPNILPLHDSGEAEGLLYYVMPYVEAELRLLTRMRVVVTLGRIAHDAWLRAAGWWGRLAPAARPKFRHGAVTRLPDGTILIASYHPSRQNTNTGRLTRRMWYAIFRRVRRELGR